MQRIDVSIIVTVYNTENKLKRCLRSLINQSICNYEIVIVNDCSNGNCDRIVERYIMKNYNIKYIKLEKRVGIYCARQIGVDNSLGKYIGFVDSDDYIHHDMYKLLYQKISTKSCDIAECGYCELDLRIKYKVHTKETVLNGFDIFRSLYRLGNVEKNISHHIWNKLFSRKLWNQCLPKFPLLTKDNDGCEDLIRVSILFYYAKSYICTDNCSYFYDRSIKSSASQSLEFFKIERYIIGLENVISNLNKLIENDFIEIEDLVNNKLWFDLLDLLHRIKNVRGNERDELQAMFIDKFYYYIYIIIFPSSFTESMPDEDILKIEMSKYVDYFLASESFLECNKHTSIYRLHRISTCLTMY